jgi:hypothetical protein
VIDRYAPLVTAAYGIWVARPASTATLKPGGDGSQLNRRVRRVPGGHGLGGKSPEGSRQSDRGSKSPLRTRPSRHIVLEAVSTSSTKSATDCINEWPWVSASRPSVKENSSHVVIGPATGSGIRKKMRPSWRTSAAGVEVDGRLPACRA